MGPRSRLVVAALSTTLVAYVAVGTLLSRALGDTSYAQLALFNEVVRLVIDAYVEPVNLDRAMAGARLGLADALDGDSAYLDAEEYRLYGQRPNDSEADVGLVLSRRFGFLVIVGARPGSPAAKAGVRSGDLLKSIDGRHTRPLAPQTGERLLRGAPGSAVKLYVLRSSNVPIEITLVRERLVPVPARGRLLGDGNALLRIGEFSPRTVDEAKGELESLRRQGARGLAVDLRGAAYGTPADGVKVAELLLRGGMIAKLSGKDEPERLFQAEASRSAWSGPVTVLIDSGTAGAAEVVAAALGDAGRPVVGERTFGRAGVQKAIALPEGGLVLTVARYLSPKGIDIHSQGIQPSVPVAAVRPAAETAPEAQPSDPTLDKAIELLKAEIERPAKPV